MTIYTLRSELRREKLSVRQNVSERCSNILEHITYKPFEENFEESGFLKNIVLQKSALTYKS